MSLIPRSIGYRAAHSASLLVGSFARRFLSSQQMSLESPCSVRTSRVSQVNTSRGYSLVAVLLHSSVVPPRKFPSDLLAQACTQRDTLRSRSMLPLRYASLYSPPAHTMASQTRTSAASGTVRLVSLCRQGQRQLAARGLTS